MARARTREMSMEEYEQWEAAEQQVKAIAAAADEEGGPRVSFVVDPTTTAHCGGTDWIGGEAAAEPKGLAIPFSPEESRNRMSGWSAHRQRAFIEGLAETGTVHLAARRAGLSARSAYQLRLRSPAFAEAWNAAQQLAVGRLSALAFDRAIHGRLEQVYQGGELVGERRVPSEKLLMWLLARLDPKRFAMPWETRGDHGADPQAEAAAAFDGMLSALTDTPEFTRKVEQLLAPEPPQPEAEESAPEPAASDPAADEPAEPEPSPPRTPVVSAKIGKIGGSSPLALVSRRALSTGETAAALACRGRGTVETG